MKRKKPGPKPKVEKKSDPIYQIIEEASSDLMEAVDSYEGEEDDDFGYIMEKVLHASGLLKGTVLIMKDREKT